MVQEVCRIVGLADVLGRLGKAPNTRVCLEADGARFREKLLEVLAG